MKVQLTKGQLGKVTETARLFGCTPPELVVALAMGNLAMHGRVHGIENATNIAEFIRDHVTNGETPVFDPSELGIRPPVTRSRRVRNALEAHEARETARLRGFFLVREFAAVIGRHRQFVSDRCSSRQIKTLKGGKPYRIPLEEELRWNGGAA